MQQVADELERLSTEPGIEGCALVDAATGLIWHRSGSMPDSDDLWEAAVDYWRLHQRLHLHFQALGSLRIAAMYHTKGLLAVIPCCRDPELLIVAQGRHNNVDWLAWQRRVRALGEMVASPA